LLLSPDLASDWLRALFLFDWFKASFDFVREAFSEPPADPKDVLDLPRVLLSWPLLFE
jgi:hypothetical protein